MLYRRWKTHKIDPRQAKSLADGLGVNPLLAKVLLARGVDTPARAKEKYFDFHPLSDPFLMKDMDKAVQRIGQAIENGEKIVVYGDYDADGVCATATLFTYLESVGANAFYKLPNREKEGYGLNKGVLQKLKEKGVDLVITVDNGIAAVDEVDFANRICLDVIITDHHLPKATLPNALAVVDPLRADDTSPCKTLAGVGVAFKLVCALEGADCREMLDYYGDVVALGTVADLMLLAGENRSIVKAGMELLNSSPRTGLEALIKTSGMEGKEITGENIAFTLAPRINAAGRMGDATQALELLLCEDREEAMETARFLEEENRRRQDTQNKIADGITAEIRKDADFDKCRVIVVWGENYHPGVVGIVASKLTESYGKPAIVFTKDGDDYKGSGRGVANFSLYAALSACSDLLIKFGGHEMAAGLSIQKENLEAFRSAINEFALKDENMAKTADLVTDCTVSTADLTIDAVEQLKLLEPFGSGNPRPVFVAENVQITAVIPVSEGKHTRVKFSDGVGELSGIMFNTSPKDFAYKPGDYGDICFGASVSRWQGRDMLSLVIKEVRPAKMPDSVVDGYELYRLFKNDFPLSRDKKQILRPVREDVALVYRKILSGKINCEDLRPLFASLPINSGKIRVILDILQDLGLIEAIFGERSNCFVPVSVSEKKDLMSSNILKALQ